MNPTHQSNNISQFTNLAEIEQSLKVTDYLLNRLTKAQKFQFEAQLATDESLQKRLEQEIEFSKALVKTEQSYTVSKDNFADFSKKITDLENQQPVASESNLTKINSGKVTHFLAYKNTVGIAASLLFLLSITFITTNLIQDHPIVNDQTGFRTLSNEANLIDNSAGTVYQVIFSEELKHKNIVDIADKYGFKLIKVSTENNRYLIQVAQPLSNVEQGLLRDTDDIIFIEKAVLEN